MSGICRGRSTVTFLLKHWQTGFQRTSLEEDERNWGALSDPPACSPAKAMPKSGPMPDIKLLAADEWLTLREIRLSALHDSPDAFLSTYEREREFGEDEWRAEFNRGDWTVGAIGKRSVSLVGITQELDAPVHERYLEYLWVTPEFRRNGIAFNMINVVLSRLKRSGVRTVFLWVLDGNEAAVRLYRRVGFVSNHHRQPLEAYPGRSEELMQLDLAEL
jgi:ribosomal protein S18 acetylase RimI-like enzyme